MVSVTVRGRVRRIKAASRLNYSAVGALWIIPFGRSLCPFE